MRLLLVALVLAGMLSFLRVAHLHPQAPQRHTEADRLTAKRSHNKIGSPVSAGVCSSQDGAATAADQRAVAALLRETLPGRWVVWQNLTVEGLPVSTDAAFPDFLACPNASPEEMSLFLAQTRADAPAKMGLPEGISTEDLDEWAGGVYRPDDCNFRRHNRGRPLLAGVNTDPWKSGQCETLDLVLDVKLAHPYAGCPSVYIPRATINLMLGGFDFEKGLAPSPGTASLDSGSSTTLSFSERKFCVLVCDPCRRYPVSDDGAILWAFMDVLETLGKRCDIIGECNIDDPNPPECSPDLRPRLDRAAITAYKGYRFALSFERAQIDGLISEALVLAKRAGSIPVYWGDPGIRHRVNPEAMIDVTGFVEEERVLALRDTTSASSGGSPVDAAKAAMSEDLQKAAEALLSLDSNPSLLEAKRQASLILPSTEPKKSVLHPAAAAKALNTVLVELESFLVRED